MTTPETGRGGDGWPEVVKRAKWILSNGNVHTRVDSEIVLAIDAALTTQAETIRQLEGEVARVKEELEDGNGAYRDVMREACAGGITYETDDRLHCTCVPHLRQGIAELKQRAEAAEGLLKRGTWEHVFVGKHGEPFEMEIIGYSVQFTLTPTEAAQFGIVEPATGEGA